MRKTLAAIFSLTIIASFCVLRTAPVQAYIETYYWATPPFYRGYDDFYGAYVIAYKAGSTAQLMIRVYNDWYTPQITVIAVKVWFDWNINYSSTETPCTMQRYEYRNFIINVTVPGTNVASNMIPHNYRIYVEFTYDIGRYYWSYYPYEYFAVYSSDQADAFDLSNKYWTYYNSFPYYYFKSAEACSLVRRAVVEATLGKQYYTRGDFARAKTQYGTAVNLYEQALTKETEYTVYLQELELNITQAELEVQKIQAEAAKTEADAAMIMANATKTQADAAMVTANAIMNQSYAWLLFGIGFVIMGIGVLVYAARKPKTPQPPQPQ